jgi:hypothetical protein
MVYADDLRSDWVDRSFGNMSECQNAAKTELAIYFKRKDVHGKAKEVTQWSLSVQRRILKRLLAVGGIAARNRE